MGLKGFDKVLPTRRNTYCGVGSSTGVRGSCPSAQAVGAVPGGEVLGFSLERGASFVRRWVDVTSLGLSAFFRRENCQTFGNELLTVLARL